MSIPDISGFEAVLFRDKAYTLHVSNHLNHFTPETIRLFIRRTGFITERIVHHGGDTDMIKSAGYLENKVFFHIIKIFPVRKLLLRPLIRVLSLLGKTSRMTVFARKVSSTL